MSGLDAGFLIIIFDISEVSSKSVARVGSHIDILRACLDLVFGLEPKKWGVSLAEGIGILHLGLHQAKLRF